MDDPITPRNDSSRTAVDPDGKVFKSKPTRRAGRRRRNKKKNQTSHIDKLSQQQLSESSIAHAQNSNNNRSDGNSNDDNNGIPPKISTRDASTNTIISATNTSFDDIHPRSIKTNKIHVKPRSIHDDKNCYEESLVPFKLHDEAFYLQPRSKTLVKVCINKVFRPSNPLCAIRYYSSAIDSGMFHDQLYIILKRGNNPSSIMYCKTTTRLYHKICVAIRMIQSMCTSTNDYHQKSIGKLVALLSTAKVQGK